MSLALVFPGQGAQSVGMGIEFYETNEKAKAIFEQADLILRGSLSISLKQVMFKGPEEELKKTDYTQPAIFTISCAIFESFKDKFSGKVFFTAGHSLGEYSALYAAGAFDFETGIKLVSRRGELMQEASVKNKGSMAAVLGLEKDQILALCEKVKSIGYMAPANFNSPGQIVVSGDTAAIEAGEAIAKELGAKRYIKLAVAGAFHSNHMQAAADAFAMEVDRYDIKDIKIPVISNFYAKEVSKKEEIKDALIKQITGSVRWIESTEYMKSKGVDTFIELGPGTVLSGLIKKIDKNLKVYNIEKPTDEAKIVL